MYLNNLMINLVPTILSINGLRYIHFDIPKSEIRNLVPSSFKIKFSGFKSLWAMDVFYYISNKPSLISLII